MPLRNVQLQAKSQLELSEIQGDVLIGLQKKVEAFLLFDIADIAHFKAALKGALGRIVFCDEAARREQVLLAAKNSQAATPNFVAANVLFSNAGIAKLTDVAGTNLGDAFSRSVDERNTLLKDLKESTLPAFVTTPDAILLVTTADEPSLSQEVAAWRAIFGAAIRERHFEIGRVRPGAEKGHEHFGFLDGVSQPGVEGLTTAAQHAPNKPAGDPKQGLPGQDLIKPGAFVLGYPNQGAGVATPPIPWMRNGSYMVLRRLEQQVEKFNSFLTAAAPPNGLTPDHLGALLVGRWKSGAPVMLATGADNPALGDDIFSNNDFDFNADNHQEKCPFLGHIRKSYPRDDLDLTTEFPNKGEGEAFAETHRILRAGIPFGFEINQDPVFGANEQPGHEASRGLMFVCYQSSIEAGFEFIQTQWCNNADFVFDKTAVRHGPVIKPGIDMIIGQTDQVSRFGNMSTPNRTAILNDVQPFVTPTGTGYFFSPSRTALHDVLT